MAIIKANAYGHGLVGVATALPDADAFLVARIDEASALRRAGVKNRVLLLEGVTTAADLLQSVQNDFDCVINNSSQLTMLGILRSQSTSRIWLKFDSGMNRLGFRCEFASQASHRLAL